MQCGMPKYFFDVHQASRVYEDHTGQACSDLAAARALAHDIINDLRKDPELSGAHLCVRDESGNEVLRLGVDTLH
jgi:hypothetical protein